MGTTPYPPVHRHAEHLTLLKVFSTGCITRRCIFEWGFGLCQDTCYHVRFLCQKHTNVLHAFGNVAGFTSEGEVAYSTATVVSARMDMLDLQWHVLSAAIGTGPVPLHEQVLA